MCDIQNNFSVAFCKTTNRLRLCTSSITAWNKMRDDQRSKKDRRTYLIVDLGGLIWVDLYQSWTTFKQTTRRCSRSKPWSTGTEMERWSAVVMPSMLWIELTDVGLKVVKLRLTR
ncbi:unnamed protein product [Cylicocyclus nassatus]|uniref:Uncharacterized protein n=1 Tax=Cylicocyclus nassatus TaxID=53992 RepID=A0AA36GYL1_CYLNA|nr:unnamed protein product [Cylicocyclus nassatus]